MDADDCGRPTDRRFFSLGGLLRGGLNLLGATGIPGVSQGARLASSLTRGGSRTVKFNRAVGRQQGRFQAAQQVGRTSLVTTTRAATPAQQRAAAAAQGIVLPRRRLNVTNVKALRRATRRVNGFVKVATRALEGTGFKVVRRTTTKKVGPRTIVESGPGSVVTR